MKKLMNLVIATIILSFGVTVLNGCEKGNSAADDDALIKESSVAETGGDCSCLANAPATITPEEEDMLVYMREEEKLARDVYLTLFDQYQEQIFKNISNSEQRHMDKVLCLLEHYGLEDPASADIGVFSNEELQQLYNDLVEQGSASLVDALTVGATIEDVDIYDLELSLEEATNEAIVTIFNRLMCGSRNHMRAFSGMLAENGGSYTPQYISQEAYDDILASDHERCGKGSSNGGNNGNNGNCNGSGNGNGNSGNNGNNGNCNGSGNGGNNGGNNGNGGNGNGGNNGGNNGNGGGN
jgi:hypothetical protein